MNPPSPAPENPLPQRALRVAALLLQSVIAALILTLGLIGVSAPMREQVFSILDGTNQVVAATVTIICVAFVAFAVAVFLVSWRVQLRSWWRIGIGYVAAGAVLAYLAHDEPTFRRPMTMEEISPVFPGEEASYGVLMQYGKQHPLGRTFTQPNFKKTYPVFDTRHPAVWRETVTSHRAEIEEHWAALGAERSWWAELDAFDRIGDLTPGRWDAEIITFQIFRTITQHGLAVASLQALDGHGDDAVDTLLPILEVGRKLQPYSRYLVREMVGIVIERDSLETAAFILDNATVSPAARARLADALKGGDPEAGARHLMSTDYAINFSGMSSLRVGDYMDAMANGTEVPWQRRLLNAISPFLFNPHATYNQIGDL
jgi:hypothetical protein